MPSLPPAMLPRAPALAIGRALGGALGGALSLALASGCADPSPKNGGATPSDDTAGTADDTGEASAPIVLRWIPVDDEPWAEAEAGLWWALAGLGALPAGDAIETVEMGANGGELLLFPDRLGLGLDALAALRLALEPVRESDAVTRLGAVDVGRLLMRTLYEPWVYYAVTGACSTVEGWTPRLPDDAPQVAITESMLTETDRRVRLAPGPLEAQDLAWLAEEGTGSLVEGTFEVRGVEVLDLMPSGRFRYAIYDEDGNLTAAPDPAHSPAGQPGRCMWCHENHLMLTLTQPDVSGFLPFADFVTEVNTQQAQVQDERRELDSPVNWSTHEVHAWAEVLVEGFLLPTSGRLAREWGVETETAEAWMVALGAAPSPNEEYPEWGPVWTRADADRAFALHLGALAQDPDHPWSGVDAADYTALAVHPSARELAPQDATFARDWPQSSCPE
jgi:hypothetical protein